MPTRLYRLLFNRERVARSNASGVQSRCQLDIFLKHWKDLRQPVLAWMPQLLLDALSEVTLLLGLLSFYDLLVYVGYVLRLQAREEALLSHV